MNDIERRGRQLTFDIKQHPDVDDEQPIGATVKASIELGVKNNLQPGDQLVVVVQNADGEVIAQGELDVTCVSFVPITEKGSVLGMHRQHKAKLST